MRSQALADRPARPEARVDELLVLWQHPTSREILPIGRFTYDGHVYRFRYTRTAAQMSDFRPLPGFGEIGAHYESETLPVVFDQRVMTPERRDYGSYLAALGLNASTATPWEQIVRSGGSRQGDTLQFMQLPTVRNGRARAQFFANGIRHAAGATFRFHGQKVTVSEPDHEAALQRLHEGSQVWLEPEVGNPKDPDAMLVTTGNLPIGWVPRVLATSIRELAEQGLVVATVRRIGQPSAPAHIRLVLEMDVEAPVGFEFDRDGRWEPAGATST